MLNPHIKISRRGSYILGAISFIAVLAIWSAISGLGLMSATKLPPPGKVLDAFLYLLWDNGNSLLLEAAWASFIRIAAAAMIVLAIGIPIGILMGASPVVNGFLSPLVDPFRSAPVVALLPVFVMWFGINETMKIVFLFVCAVVYLIPMTRDAIKSVPYTYWESARDLGASDVECITKAVLPMAAPRIFDAGIISISILWTYITVAEYVNAGSGLGLLISNARKFSAMDQVFVAIFTIIVLALATYTGLMALRNKIYHWEKAQ